MHRKVVGWSLANHMRASLDTDAFRQALGSQNLSGSSTATTMATATIFHIDRGSQYSSTAFCQLLTSAGMKQSMSARANPYHNAWDGILHRHTQIRNATRRMLPIPTRR